MKWREEGGGHLVGGSLKFRICTRSVERRLPVWSFPVLGHVAGMIAVDRVDGVLAAGASSLVDEVAGSLGERVTRGAGRLEAFVIGGDAGFW